MIHAPVVECDMCHQRVAMVGWYEHWELPRSWRWEQPEEGDDFHVCPNKACMDLFRKQCGMPRR